MPNEYKIRNGLIVAASGSTIMSVDGASGRLFSVDDSLSGSLFSVNTAAGLPVIEAFSDNTIRMGQYGRRVLFVSQSFVGIGKETSLNTTLDVSGSFGVTGSVFLPSLAVTPTNTNVVTINTTTGQLGYTASAALGGGSTGPIAVTGSTLYSTNPATSNINVNDNILLGYRAGTNATNAASSNFLGGNAGWGATNAGNSNFLGANAGTDATNAYSSNFLGQFTGQNASNAQYSNFIGDQAGESAINAKYSNFLGANAGQSAGSASYSTLIGYQVGYNAAGNPLGIKSNNIIIGTNITLPDGASNAINLGAIIFATGSYATTTGNPFSGAAMGKVGINQPTPNYTLDVSGSIYASNGITGSLFGTASWAQNSISSSYPIAVTGSTIYSVGPATSQVSPNNSIFLGSGSGYQATSAEYSNVLGYEAGYQSTYASNTNIFGTRAGYQMSAGNNSNIIGDYAGYQVDNSDYFTLIGSYAGYQALGINNSHIIGDYAGYEASGSYNVVFIGAAAGNDARYSRDSIFIGNNGGSGAGASQYSVFIGSNVANNAVSSSYSVVLGYRAATNASNLNNNIIIGTNVTVPNGVSNAINLGGLIFGTGSYSTPSGPSFSGAAMGKIGINQPNPNYTLDVAGTIYASSSININSTVSAGENTLVLGTPPNGGIGEGGQVLLAASGGLYTSASMLDNYQNKFRILRGTNANSDAFKFQLDMGTGQIQIPNYTNSGSFPGTAAAFLAVDSSGNVITSAASGSGGGGASLSGGKINYNAIWSSTTTVSTGSVYQYSATQVQITGSSLAVGNIVPSATAGRIDASNDIVAFSTSDSRFKINVKPIENALSKVEQINGVEFDWLENPEHHGNKGHDIGVIAQELEQVLPEVVTTRDSGYKAVKYDKIVALLIQAVKEQQIEINELKAKINGLTE